MRVSASVRLCAALATCLCVGSARADYERGRVAQERWDYARAETEFKAGATAGDRASMRALARLYFRQGRGRADAASFGKRALPLLTRAAELGDGLAQASLAAVHLADPKSAFGGLVGVTPSALGIEQSVSTGIELLRGACKAEVEESCLQLALVYAGKFSARFVNTQVAEYKAEAERWAAIALPRYRRRADAGEAEALWRLSQDYPWPGVTEDDRVLYAALWEYARGATGTDTLSRISDPQALTQRAAQWEIARGLRPQAFDVAAMTTIIVDALERVLTVRARARIAAAAGAGFAVMRAGRDIADPRQRRTTADLIEARLVPVEEWYFAAQDELAKQMRLDYRSALAGELQKVLSPRQLHFLSAFFASDAGRKLLDYKVRIQPVRAEAFKLSLVAFSDIAGAGRGTPEYRNGLVAFAKQAGLVSDLDLQRDGGFTRAEIALKSGAPFPGEEPRGPAMEPEFLLMVGRDYENISRSLSNAQSYVPIEPSPAWKTLVETADALQAKLRALPAAIQLDQELADRTAAVLKQAMQRP